MSHRRRNSITPLTRHDSVNHSFCAVIVAILANSTFSATPGKFAQVQPPARSSLALRLRQIQPPPTSSFTPTSGGLYYAALTVDDGDGGPTGFRTLTRQIEVKGLPSSLTLVAPTSGSEGQTVRVRIPESELGTSRRIQLLMVRDQDASCRSGSELSIDTAVERRGRVLTR